MSTKPKPLPPESLFTPCKPSIFSFKTTAEIEPREDIYGQKRAVEAVHFAIGMPGEGYNLFASGPEGIGRFSLIKMALEKRAMAEPVPDDWCYVHNFAEPHKPKALRLPPGKGCPLRADMEHLVGELRAAIPAAFESDEYRNRRGVIEEGLKERHEELFGGLQEEAKKREVALIQTPMGFAVAPLKDGEVMSPKDFEGLPQEEKDRRQEALQDIQKKLEETLRHVPKAEREQRDKLRTLNQEVTQYSVGFLIDDLVRRWKDQPAVVAYLEAVRADVVENVEDFLPKPREGAEGPLPAAARKAIQEESGFRRYRVNVIVDNAGLVSPVEKPGEGAAPCAETPAAGAPVVYEDHPTQPNLAGRIEHLSQFGTLVTDFNLIKPGALHRANGGYLVLDARKILLQPFAWDTLIRALRAETIRIESPAEALGWAATITLEPEPIPLKIKVMLIGEPLLYYLLSQHDPDFREMFKVTADFDTVMERTPENSRHYADVAAALVHREKLRPLGRGAVVRIVEHGSRLAGDAGKLTTHLTTIADLVRESHYWAGEAGAEVVEATHVQEAIDAKTFRSDRLRERVQEEILRGTIVIDSEAEVVGQVNGLSVLMLDHFSFGRPSRISCRVSLGRGQVVDIEREVALGGSLHSKGVLILSSYLGGKFAHERPLSLSASLVFEQSYGGVDGDSASSAELYALLSALSGIPIRQRFAVTGSVDQHGTVQAIGGVNEKIEGFFDICTARGLTGKQGVLIPATNVKHLMLRADVIEAVKKARFHIYPIATVDQGIEILTGRKAGTADKKGNYPKASVNRAVADALSQFAERARAFAVPQRRSRRAAPRPAGRRK